MSYADKLFVNMCNDILTNGTTNQGQKIRPKWEDGIPAYTIKKFGVINRYDLRKEFPAITLRRTPIISAIDEILWIWQKKTNDITKLRTHIWDAWADENGFIGKAYGYQAGLKNIYNASYNKFEYPIDQVENLLFELKNNPFSRRHILTLWNNADLHAMRLQPCCWSCTFNVTDEGNDKYVLNLLLNQRSQDVLAANNWNVVQYAALLMMIAQVSDMIPGELIHVIADAHIYDRHVDIIKDLISRPIYETAPTVTLDPDIKRFEDFVPESFKIENYVYCTKPVPKIPIAI